MAQITRKYLWGGLMVAALLGVLTACDNGETVKKLDPRTKWVYRTSCQIYYSSPALSPDEQNVYIGTSLCYGPDCTCREPDNHGLYSIAVETGALNWKYPLGTDFVRSSPMVAPDGAIYFTTESFRLIKLDPGGTLLWEVNLNPSGVGGRGDVGYHSPALGADGTVFAGGDQLYAVSPAGTILWGAPNNSGSTSYLMFNSPSVDAGNNVLVADSGFYLSSFNGASGAVNWARDSAPYVPGMWNHAYTPGVISRNGSFYLHTDWDGIFAIDVASGATNWNVPWEELPMLRSSPALDAAGNLYFGQSAAGSQPRMNARAPDGTPLWATSPPDMAGNENWGNQDIYSSPALGADGLIYFGHEFGSVYGVEMATGNYVWQYRTSYGITYSSPAISQTGLLFIGNLEGDFYAIQTGSMGLSSSAMWPKYRADSQNTGRQAP